MGNSLNEVGAVLIEYVSACTDFVLLNSSKNDRLACSRF